MIAPEGARNLVDGDFPGGGASLFVDLEERRVAATVVVAFGGFAAGATFGFEIVNFVDARGGDQGDTILGDAADNTFFGSRGDDAYDGRDGFDTLD